MTREDQLSNRFQTSSEYEVKEQQQYWNRYINQGYQPAFLEEEAQEAPHEREWEHEHDPLNRAFDPNEYH